MPSVENQVHLDLGSTARKSGPVECLGITFENDEKRREHFLGLLREKLKDPEFRKIEGFPIGADEDILALSDPPYYTACPNPFIPDFIKHYGKPYDPSVPYSREPFAADVSEGKNDPIYNAHSYHTKVPHKAIMRYILHYTEPGDVVFDGFCGTGMTGVAAQMCGDKNTVESLGFRVDKDQLISEEEIDENGKPVWRIFSKLGSRRAILSDLSPAATFIANACNSSLDTTEFLSESNRILAAVLAEYGWMYQTLHTDGRSRGTVNYTVWSDVFICPECSQEIVFWDSAVDASKGEVREEFSCKHCTKKLTKRNLERAWVKTYDSALRKTISQAKQVPVLINYSVGGKRYEKAPDAADIELIKTIEQTDAPDWFPVAELPKGDKTGEPIRIGITNSHHFYFRRALIVLSAFRRRILDTNSRYLSWFTAVLSWTGKEMRLHLGNYFNGGGGVITSLRGAIYIASLTVETNVIERMKLRTRWLGFRMGLSDANAIVECLSTSQSSVSDNSCDYVFIDPPFGANLQYSELNFFMESWLAVMTNIGPEAVENKSQRKNSLEYRKLMRSSLNEAYRILKPGRWITIEFSNTQAAVWNNIQSALTDAGFIVANVSALDKKKGSFNAVTNATSVKQDLVISAYKPNGGFEERFLNEATSEDGVWDFVRTHLKYLPVIKRETGGTLLIPVAERDPRLLYDQMVAYFVRKGFPVPLNSAAFQEGLAQRFSNRDGMYFLPDQAAEYDKKKMMSGSIEQLPLFVSDESSAIAWLGQLLKDKPLTFQDIHPLFIRELGGWQKYEKPLELSELLEQNFLRYDGKEEVPSQIHSYLSTNFKELRNLPKDAPELRAKGKDRWYVPDPNKAGDLEKLRERTLMKEFWEYLPAGYQPAKPDSQEGFIPGLEAKPAPIPRSKKMKVIRLEAVRAGFKHCWQNRDYRTIIAVAQRIPENVLQEDPKLLMWYDQALTRSGEN
jgi:DNA modification methylase